MSEDRLTRMLRKQLELQRAHGTDPTAMTGEVRIAWIREMVLACTDELHEALGEVGWKSWASSHHINEKACFGELRDAWQILTNLMFTVYQADPETLARYLEAALDEKLVKNHARVAEGYTGTEKCVSCKRALDEVVLSEVKKANGTTDLVFCACGAVVDGKIAAPYLID